MNHPQEEKLPANELAMKPACPQRPVLLFAGQGSQKAGMGRDNAESDPAAMALWKRAEAASSLPLREIYWEGDETAMSDTRALQPALTVAACNLWNGLARKTSIRPLACAGHSLGEFGALAAAGVISPEDAVDITALRGKLMAEADPEQKGAMAAIVKLPAKAVLEIVEECRAETGAMLVAANFNTPLQTVISGAKAAIELACNKAKALKGRSVPLRVSGAFHSQMMAQANEELAAIITKIKWNDPAFPVYCNVDASPVQIGREAREKILSQMVSPVRWLQTLQNLYAAGARWWLEISPQPVLGKMVATTFADQSEDMRIELCNSQNDIDNMAL